MEKPGTWDEMIESLRGNRAELLLAMNDNHPAETPKGALPDTVNSVNYHLDILVKWGLIEVVARDERGDRIPARIFGLTDEGRDAVEELFNRTDARPIPSAVEQHIEKLRSEVEEAKSEARRAQSRVDELKEVLQELAAEVEG